MNDAMNVIIAAAMACAIGCDASSGRGGATNNAAAEQQASAGGASASASASEPSTASGASAPATVGPTAAAPVAAGAPSAQQAIEGFLSAVAANDEDAAMAVLSERRRASRGNAETWGLFWNTWRAYGCSLVSMSGVVGAGASGDGAADAQVTLQCSDRTRQSRLRLLHEGAAWFWDEN